MSIEFIAVSVSAGSLIMAILVYLMRISASVGRIIDKVDRCERRLDRLEPMIAETQLDLSQRLARLESGS